MAQNLFKSHISFGNMNRSDGLCKLQEGFDLVLKVGVFANRKSFNILKCTFEASHENVKFKKISDTPQIVTDQMSVPLVLHVQNPNHPQ